MAFMAVVQMVIPALAGIAFALCASAFADSVWKVDQLWPHRLPGIVQVALMLIVAGFNVGRFHPMEEVLQSLVETLPSVILGVDPGSWPATTSSMP